MLLLTRRPGQAISIQPDKGLDWKMPLGSLFDDGPIEVVVTRIDDGGVKIGISAHSDLVILRNELMDHQPETAIPSPFASTARTNDGCSRRILARNVSHYRNNLHLTRQQLADISGLSLTTLLAIEEGKGAVRLDDLDNLARVFCVTTGRLLNS